MRNSLLITGIFSFEIKKELHNLKLQEPKKEEVDKVEDTEKGWMKMEENGEG